MLQKARDRGANYFELFSNSPMWWMCKNDNPSGQPKSYQENLAPANHGKFATISPRPRDGSTDSTATRIRAFLDAGLAAKRHF
jgi:hypothetical protein